MELSVLSTDIAEPVSVDDVKAFMGYMASDQDAIIFRMIHTAREWLENRCAISIVNKQYKAYFEKIDAVNGWYELPVTPILASPAIILSICGTSTTFEQRGLKRISVRPTETYGTVSIGATWEVYYVEVTFNAGATNHKANETLMYIVNTMFNTRDSGDTGVSIGRLPYFVLQMIDSLDENTGI